MPSCARGRPSSHGWLRVGFARGRGWGKQHRVKGAQQLVKDDLNPGLSDLQMCVLSLQPYLEPSTGLVLFLTLSR